MKVLNDNVLLGGQEAVRQEISARGTHDRLKAAYRYCMQWIFLVPERFKFTGSTPLDGAQIAVPLPEETGPKKARKPVSVLTSKGNTA